MPERAEEIRRAHLADVMETLRAYVEAGHEITLDTAYIAEDRGAITVGIDLSVFHPMLRTLTERRFGAAAGDQTAAP